MQKNTLQGTVRIVMIIICCILIIISLFGIGNTLNEYRRSREEYEALEKLIFTAEEEEETEQKAQPSKQEEKENEAQTEEPDEEALKAIKEAEALELARERAIKEKDAVNNAIQELHRQNEDVAGWIRFLTVDISYPIMHGETNDEYIRHTWSGMANTAGSIFLEALNRPDFNDSHTIIYGHNMKNKTMFGKLSDYKEEGTYEKCPYFLIYTGEKVYEYQIFSYYDVSETDSVYTIYYEPSDEFGQMVQNMQKQSWIDPDLTVGKDDKVITLSTCSTEGRRFIVCAVRVNEY